MQQFSISNKLLHEFADVQDDVVMGTLTVRENLMFSANLRLPQTMKDEEKQDRVDEAIEELGLDRCADTKVSNRALLFDGGTRSPYL